MGSGSIFRYCTVAGQLPRYCSLERMEDSITVTRFHVAGTATLSGLQGYCSSESEEKTEAMSHRIRAHVVTASIVAGTVLMAYGTYKASLH